MSITVDNAIIMAAGTSSRFAPLSYEKHKALISVKGEILIERQIRQLKEAGINDIIIVTGYKAEDFYYLKDKFGVTLIHNNEYLTRNNNGSIYVVKDYLSNSYVCSSDNYFSKNPFENEVDSSYYAAVFAKGHTDEWCMTEDKDGFINSVTIGGENSWYMLGHTFWDENFSKKFIKILDEIYYGKDTVNKLWEAIFMEHLDVLKMKIKRYDKDFIYEFDTLDELRLFDDSYYNESGSAILKEVANTLSISEKDIINITATKTINNEAEGFTFVCKGKEYEYYYKDKLLKERF